MALLDGIELGIGTWAWGEKRLWGYGRRYQDADLEATYRAALSVGLSFFDSAEIYGSGEAERLLGRFQAAQGPARIASKFMPYPWRWRRGDLLAALRATLARLGRPSLDLYQIHAPLPPRSIATWCQELAEAVKQGLCAEVGVSNFSRPQMLRARDALAALGVPLASNQMPYSLLRREHEHSGLLDCCRREGIRFIAYSPLGLGWLGGAYRADSPLPWARRLISRRGWPQVQRVLQAMEAPSQAHGKSPSQVALNWLLCKGALPIPGARSAEQAQAHAGALGWRLNAAEVSALDAASLSLRA